MPNSADTGKVAGWQDPQQGDFAKPDCEENCERPAARQPNIVPAARGRKAPLLPAHRHDSISAGMTLPIRTIGPAVKARRHPGFHDLLHRAANASRPENVMHASHQGIGRERCAVFDVKMVWRLMAPAGIVSLPTAAAHTRGTAGFSACYGRVWARPRLSAGRRRIRTLGPP